MSSTFQDGLSTSTRLDDGRIVPWLAASGSLSYSPECPPESLDLLDYSRSLSRIIREDEQGGRIRTRNWFGCKASFELDHASLSPYVTFWERARAGKPHTPIYVRHGERTGSKLTMPIAVYKFDYRVPHYMLIQHGSHLFLSAREQPFIEDGFIILYRGIFQRTKFEWPVYEPERMTVGQLEVFHHHLDFLEAQLSDSVQSLSMAHEDVFRWETEHLTFRHRLIWNTFMHGRVSWTKDDDLENPWMLAASFFKTFKTPFTVHPGVAQGTFGPSWVSVLTPLDNIHMTSFFAGEGEVYIQNPARMHILNSVGCEAEKVLAPQWWQEQQLQSEVRHSNSQSKARRPPPKKRATSRPRLRPERVS